MVQYFTVAPERQSLALACWLNVSWIGSAARDTLMSVRSEKDC